MKVTIYGTGCARCQQTATLMQQVLSERGISIELEKVTDYAQIVAAGIMATPAVALNGRIVSTGKLPTRDEIAGWLA